MPGPNEIENKITDDRISPLTRPDKGLKQPLPTEKASRLTELDRSLRSYNGRNLGKIIVNLGEICPHGFVPTPPTRLIK